MTEKNFQFKNEESNKEKAMLKAEAKLDNDESSTLGGDSFNSEGGSTTNVEQITEQDQILYKEEKEKNKRAVTPTWKKEEIWVQHQQRTHPRKIAKSVQLSLGTVNRIIENYTEQEKNNPEEFNSERNVLTNAFISKAWEIIGLADKLTVAKLQEGKASALQANIIAGVKIDKILVLQGKASKIIEEKHYLDKDMFKDLAKILTKSTYEHE